jgi:hypothetical protein
MKYFNTLPSVITSDYNGNTLTLKNILTRATLVSQLQNNPLLFYTYTTQDGDTPESVAYKYYGDQYRYWIVLYGNGSLDPQFDWPLTSRQFNDFIIAKYTNDAANALSISANTVTSNQVLVYTQNTLHHYEKSIATTDNASRTQSIKVIEIDGTTANQVVSGTTTISFADGTTATQTVSVNPISIYNYENTLNENKRNIKLINSNYVGSMESQFQSLMSR